MHQEKTGNFLAECRKQKNLTQEQLSEILGVSSKSVSRWENGKTLPDYTIFQFYLRLLKFNATTMPKQRINTLTPIITNDDAEIILCG